MQSKKSFLILIVLGVALLVLIGLIFVSGGFSRSDGSSLSAVKKAAIKKAAEVFPYSEGALAKIQPMTDSFPNVSLTQLKSNEYTDTVQSCWTKEFRDRYGGPAYDNALTQSAKCLAGQLSATLYMSRLQDTETSIAKVTTMLNDIKKLASALAKKKFTDDLDVILIPGGVDVEKTYPFSDGVSIKCIKDRNTKTPLINEIGVGTISKQQGRVFEETNNALNVKLKEFKKKNKETYDFVKKQKKQGSDLSNGAIIDIAKVMGSLKAQVAGSFVAILPEDLHKDYREFETAGLAIGLTIQFEKDSTGIPIKSTNKVPFAVRKTLAIMPGLGIVWNDDYFSAIITVDDASYPSVPFPANAIFGDLKSKSQNHIVRLEKLKKTYEMRVAQYKKILEGLAAKNYNCDDTTPSKQSTLQTR